MKIYTRTGDQGETSLIGGRVSKDHVRVEAYGTVDECNAQIGEAMTHCRQSKQLISLTSTLEQLQHELFDIGADLAQTAKRQQKYRVDASMVDRLEAWIDQFDQELKPIQRFILPGGCPAAASFHLCRVIARRAERRVVTLYHQEEGNEEIRRYLNRLSDLLFVLARVANARMNIGDIEYTGKEAK